MSTCNAAQRTANHPKRIHHNTFVLLASARSCERPRAPCEYDTNLPLVIHICDTLVRTSDAQATSSGIVIANSEWDQTNVLSKTTKIQKNTCQLRTSCTSVNTRESWCTGASKVDPRTILNWLSTYLCLFAQQGRGQDAGHGAHVRVVSLHGCFNFCVILQLGGLA